MQQGPIAAESQRSKSFRRPARFNDLRLNGWAFTTGGMWPVRIALRPFLRFIPRERPVGPVAQWLEPAAHNGLVAGSSPARPTSHSPVSAHFVSSAESPDISEGCHGRCCPGAVSRGIFGLRRLIAPRRLWLTDLLSWRSKGRDGRDRFAIGGDGFGRLMMRLGAAPWKVGRLVHMSAFNALPWRLQPERSELLRPVARQVGEAGKAGAPRRAIVSDGHDKRRSEEGQREQHRGPSNRAFLLRCKIRDIKYPAGDEVVERAARLGDGGKPLCLRVRPSCSCVGMNALNRRDELLTLH